MENKDKLTGGYQHGFSNGKSFLTHLALYVGVTASVDKRRVNDLMDLSKAFDAVLHDILMAKLKKN